MDGPVQVGVFVVKRNGAVARPYRQVPVEGMKFEKIADHRFFLVAERNGEFVHAIGVVVLHDVPNDRLAADLDQPIWLFRPPLRNEGAKPPPPAGTARAGLST